MTFLVTVHDPYSSHPHLTDREIPCETTREAAERFLEESHGDRFEGPAIALGLGIGQGFSSTDPETGVEVTAHRVGDLVAGGAG